MSHLGCTYLRQLLFSFSLFLTALPLFVTYADVCFALRGKNTLSESPFEGVKSLPLTFFLYIYFSISSLLLLNK